MKELILLPLYRLIHCWERRLGTAMRRTMLPPWKIVEALSENGRSPLSPAVRVRK